ncbi:MAG: hypothetical protein CVU78_00585 [Elusimicrobia bacterium HGW-Elusimicrobia-2]|nr:MAG: hypothetical protein CVU78_00585 [Elusimicrobia bacterium HGW-Elusimicrobia-2]
MKLYIIVATLIVLSNISIGYSHDKDIDLCDKKIERLNLINAKNPEGSQGFVYFPQSIKKDESGNIYIFDELSQSVNKYNSSGDFIFKIDKEKGVFEIQDFDINSKGDVYIAGFQGILLFRESKVEDLIDSFNFQPPVRISIVNDIHLYIIDSGGVRTRKYDICKNPILLKEWAQQNQTGESNIGSARTSQSLLSEPIKSSLEEFKLNEVYAFPNPAEKSNPTIHIECGSADKVEIRIYTIAGEPVHSVIITEVPKIIASKLAYEYTWNCSGKASGVYLYLVRAKKGEKVLTALKKLALIK